MAELTQAEQQALADLEAKQSAPDPRTDTGVKGVLHTLIDVASGVVPHLADDVWARLHNQVEHGDGQDQAAAAVQPSVFGSESAPETSQ